MADSSANVPAPGGAQPAKSSKQKRRRNPSNWPKSQRRTEIEALRKKYDPVQINPELYQVILTPSDPDFAFPIDVLDFDLNIPQHYPHGTNVASIKVNNQNVPRGYALNIEKGFLQLEGSLVEKVEKLDMALESYLKMDPQKTITIVPVRKKPADTKPKPKPQPKPNSPQKSEPTAEPKAAQKVKEVKLEAKLENVSLDDDAGYAPAGSVAYANENHAESGSESGSESESESDSDSDWDLVEREDDVEPGMEKKNESARPARRGTELVFPDFVMSNLSVCEVVSLNLLFKCGRCKHLQEFKNLMSAEYGQESKPRIEPCEKCGLGLLVAFRKEFLHASSLTAGFLDISGGNIADMLPSSFSGICAECNTVSPLFRNVDFGSPRELLCRNCHAHLTIKLEVFRFDVLSTDTLGSKAKSAGAALAAARKEDARKQKLKLTGGEPLPNDGACEHYRKSLRWFRFSCCKRVFPCDRCHDAEMGHEADLAQRMVCGKCSREQRFDQICQYCKYNFVVKQSGFWEGGSGTRNRTLLQKKDPRKNKGRYHDNEEKSSSHFKGKSQKVGMA